MKKIKKNKIAHNQEEFLKIIKNAKENEIIIFDELD